MVNIFSLISAVIKVEYLDVCHIVEFYWDYALISRYYGSIFNFHRADKPSEGPSNLFIYFSSVYRFFKVVRSRKLDLRQK